MAQNTKKTGTPQAKKNTIKTATGSDDKSSQVAAKRNTEGRARDNVAGRPDGTNSVGRDTARNENADNTNSNAKAPKTSSSGKAKLFAVSHEGYTTRVTSLVAAGSEGDAVVLLKEALADHELVHAQGPIHARPADGSESENVKISGTGVVHLNLGHSGNVIRTDKKGQPLDAADQVAA